MNRLVLTTDEARRLHDGTLTEIRRKVDLSARDHRCHMWAAQNDDGGWTFADAPLEGGLWDALRCLPGKRPPLGKPGDLLWIAEDWGVGCRPDPFSGSRDGVEYRADEAYLVDESDTLTLYDVTPPDDVDLCEYEGKGWQPAESMPQWCSRATMRLTAVRAERTGDVWEWVYGLEKV